jgi:DNA-binding beta-propeller fold protein YncE
MRAGQSRVGIIDVLVARGGSFVPFVLVLTLSCMHNRPDPPDVPVGPSNVEVDSAYTFNASASSGRQYEQHGLVWIRFEWGDGDTSSWCGHGETVECPHSWRDGGIYSVRAQARDDRSKFSEWSEPLNVTAVVPAYPYRLVDSVSIIDAPLIDAQVTPDGRFVYVTNDWSGALSVVRTTDLQLVAQISFNHGWGSDGQVVCSPSSEYAYATWYHSGGGIAVVRAADQVVTDSLTLEGRLRGLTISPDGQRLFVAVEADSGLIVDVRLPDNVIEDTIFTPGVWSYTTSLQVAPDGTRLYAGSLETGDVYAIDLSDNTVEWRVPLSGTSTASGAVAMHPSGSPLYVVDHQGISILESGTGTIIDTIPLQGDLGSARVAPDGSLLYVTSSDSAENGSVVVVQTSDNKVVRVIAMPDEVYDVAASPDGQRLYVAADNGKLYVLGR